MTKKPHECSVFWGHNEHLKNNFLFDRFIMAKQNKPFFLTTTSSITYTGDYTLNYACFEKICKWLQWVDHRLNRKLKVLFKIKDSTHRGALACGTLFFLAGSAKAHIQGALPLITCGSKNQLPVNVRDLGQTCTGQKKQVLSNQETLTDYTHCHINFITISCIDFYRVLAN